MQQEMGNGVCTISPRTEGLTQLFSTDEVVWFDHEDEILENVNWYKSHESEARSIGQRGWKAVHERCNAKRVAQFMIDLAFDQPLSEDYEWSSQIIKPH
jgi:spore maturation protein CgeB